MQAQVDLQTRILNRFDSPQEFSSFLQTDGGQRFVTGLTHERDWRPARRIIVAVQIGIVLAVLGLGFFVLAGITQRVELAYPGTIILFLGIGFLASSLASYRMSKNWSLLPGPSTRGADELTGEIV